MYTHFRLWGATKFKEFAALKLIVCATIMGRCSYMTRDDGWRDQSEAFPGAHAHVANDMIECVIFDEAQIIPCYMIHFDLGHDVATYITKFSLNTAPYINNYRAEQRKQRHASQKLGSETGGPGDAQRQKQALLAKAQKYFPYGFGAASGSNFVILDVAEVSEDEEDYGTYQKDRLVQKRLISGQMANMGHSLLIMKVNSKEKKGRVLRKIRKLKMQQKKMGRQLHGSTKWDPKEERNSTSTTKLGKRRTISRHNLR